MGCIVNGPGESKHADIGISLPGTGEQPTAPVFIDGQKAMTLRGPTLVADFKKLVEDYIEKRYGGGQASGTMPPDLQAGRLSRRPLSRSHRRRHRSEDARRRRRRQQAFRRGDPAEVRSVARHRRHQRRDREPALPRRDLDAQRLLPPARGETGRRRAIACSSPPTSPARSASRRSPGPASTISSTSSATRTTRDAFNIPHDLKILQEVFGVENGGYRARQRVLDEPVDRRSRGRSAASRAQPLSRRGSRRWRRPTPTSPPPIRRRRATRTFRWADA